MSPSAQGVYTARLDRIAADEKAPIRHRVEAITALAGIPGAQQRIQSYIASEDVNVSEAALAALAWTDVPEDAVGTLLRHASDDRRTCGIPRSGPEPDRGRGQGRTERDLPARQRLHTLVTGLIDWAGTDRDAVHELLRRCADILLPHRTLLPLAARLRGTRTLRTDTAANFVTDLNELVELHQGRPTLAAHTTHELRRISLQHADSAELHRAVRKLAKSGRLVDGLFAVALCYRGGWATAWSKTWRNLLRDLRAHSEPEVADAALAEFIAGE